MLHYHITVYGDVQGVGFRYFTQNSASLYGIAGWVRNRHDGTVEIEAEGNEANMSEFIKAVESGSRFSRVESVKIEKLDLPKGFRHFEIMDD